MKKAERSSAAIEVGARLARARKALDISQVEFASRLGETVGNLSNWENGYAMLPPELVPRIFLLTRIDSNYLYLGDPSGLPGPLYNRLIQEDDKKVAQS